MKTIEKQRSRLKNTITKQTEELKSAHEFEKYEEKRLKLIERFHHLITSPRPDIPFHISENGRTVLEKRYLKKGQEGKIIETPEDRLWTISVYVAMGRLMTDEKETEDSIYQRARKYYEIIATKKFIPNSPTLMNAGKELGQLSACFVLPVEDNTEEIFKAIQRTALIHKSGGGTGFSFSRLRPRNDVVSTTRGVASGPVSFMRVFDSATEEIKQGGTRRGANMGILNVDHPDILEFLECKKDGKKNQNFNISVAITEDFYNKALKDEEYELKNPRDGRVIEKLKAKEVMDKIVAGAWTNGEPGVVFIDRINQDNPTPKVGKIESTNPCGEQPLLPYESCNLGSINLIKFVKDKEFNFELLKETTKIAVEFLNDVIDINFYPLPEIWKMTTDNRKIGLGVMGFADMLVKLEVPYDSNESLELAERVMRAVKESGTEKSEELAKKYGAFPNFEKSIFAERGQKPLRNATITTIAPTGTISIIASASSGIEPYFAIAFVRQKVLDGEPMVEVNPFFVEIAKQKGFYSEDLMKKVADTGSVQNIKEVPENIKKIFRTALEISPEWHIKIQAAFQRYTDNAVSKTVNFPQDASPEDLREAYDLAYKLGCKGITVYRDKSRDQVLNIGKQVQEEEPIKAKLAQLQELRKITYNKEHTRGKVLPALVVREPVSENPIETEYLYVTIGYRDGETWEAFLNSKAWDVGTYEAITTNAIHTSRRLQQGENPKSIAQDIIGTPGPSIGKDKFGKNFSVSDALAHTLLLDRFMGFKEFDKIIAEKMIEMEILLLRGLLTTYNTRVAKAEIMSNHIMQLNGTASGRVSNSAKAARTSSMPKKTCPGCGSTDYQTISMSGCEYNSCCWISPKGCG